MRLGQDRCHTGNRWVSPAIGASLVEWIMQVHLHPGVRSCLCRKQREVVGALHLVVLSVYLCECIHRYAERIEYAHAWSRTKEERMRSEREKKRERKRKLFIYRHKLPNISKWKTRICWSSDFLAFSKFIQREQQYVICSKFTLNMETSSTCTRLRGQTCEQMFI